MAELSQQVFSLNRALLQPYKREIFYPYHPSTGKETDLEKFQNFAQLYHKSVVGQTTER